MIELPYRIVDVFTDRPLAGNALCVVLEPAPDAVMQAIAREMNLSETTFVTPAGPGAYDVRIFTPASELPFAGHPTLGTAWALGPGTWTQRSPGATVTVEVTAGGATFAQPDPIIEEIAGEEPAAALGLPPADKAFVMEVGGTRHVLVPTERPLGTLRFDAAAVRAVASGVRGVGVAAMAPAAGGDADVHLRLVVAAQQVFEDPGTGSAAAAVALLARRLWGIGEDVVIRQGDEIGRPSRMHVHAVPGDVRVGGAVAACAAGTLTLAAG